MNPRVLWFCALLYWLLCSGCVINTDYPLDWPKQMVNDEHNGCPDISGTFQEPGQWANDGNDVSLGEYIIGLEAAPNSITISHESNDAIVIASSMSEGASEIRNVFSRITGDYTCDGGQLWISRTTMMEPNAGIGVVIAGYKERFGFSKTEDGSLLAEVHGGGGGIMLLFMVVPIPSVATGNDYALWRLAESEEKPD